jgi:hypothetical protein
MCLCDKKAVTIEKKAVAPKVREKKIIQKISARIKKQAVNKKVVKNRKNIGNKKTVPKNIK